MIFSCRKTAQAVSMAMDEELPPRVKVGMYIHLGLCSMCRKYRKQIRFLDHLLKLCPEEFPAEGSEGMTQEEKERLVARLGGR